jgi:hypothetical protein
MPQFTIWMTPEGRKEPRAADTTLSGGSHLAEAGSAKKPATELSRSCCSVTASRVNQNFIELA